MERKEAQDLLHRNDIFFGARAWLAMDAYARMAKDYLAGN
jgi:ADP-ribose pyrophosphatase